MPPRLRLCQRFQDQAQAQGRMLVRRSLLRHTLHAPRRRGDSRSRGGAPEDDKEDAGATRQDVGTSDFDSPMPSPGSDNSRGGGCAQRKRCSSNGGGPSLSSVSSLWSKFQERE
ncbi:hypothetical protein ACQ4PT_033087 [Festuca glaucescens]